MTDGQSAILPWCQAPIWGPRPDFYCRQTVAGLLMWGAFSDDRTGLSFAVAASPRQLSHSQVRVPRDSATFYCLRCETPPTWRARSPYLYPPGTGFLFRHLLRLAGQRCWYSNPPPRGERSNNNSKSKLLYDWPFAANQFILASAPLRPTTRDFFN
jgi:hypothetical protein